MLGALVGVARSSVERRRSLLIRFWEAQYGGVLLREFALLFVMLWLYRYVRFIARDQTEAAFANAESVMQFERFLGLDFEAAFQRLLLPYEDFMVGMNRYYITFHFAGTVAFLVWAFVRSHPDYTKLRRVLVAVSAGALVIHVLYPLAPPRMMPGFVDTMALWGPNPYRSEAVSNFANQYAAMPSLHVGWSLIVAYGVVRVARSRWRWIAVAHPVLTFLAVTLTANHYWVDGAVAALLVVGAVWWFYRPVVANRDERPSSRSGRRLASVSG